MQFPTVVYIDKLLDICRRIFSKSLINMADNIGTLVGGWAIYGIAILLFIVGVIAGIRGNDAGAVVFGFLLLPLGVILQYVAVKMLGAVDRLVMSTPTSMHAEGILHVIAVGAAVIGVIGVPVSTIYGIISAIDGAYGELIWILGSVYLVYLAALALNPDRIAVGHSDKTTIGQEAIGLATFILKSLYKFVPVLFGVAAVVVAIMSLIALGQTFSLPAIAAPSVFQIAAANFVVFCLIPLLGYVMFLGYYLFIDVLRALLTLGVQAGAIASASSSGSSSGGGRGGRSKSSGSKSRSSRSTSSGSSRTRKEE